VGAVTYTDKPLLLFLLPSQTLSAACCCYFVVALVFTAAPSCFAALIHILLLHPYIPILAAEFSLLNAWLLDFYTAAFYLFESIYPCIVF